MSVAETSKRGQVYTDPPRLDVWLNRLTVFAVFAMVIGVMAYQFMPHLR